MPRGRVDRLLAVLLVTIAMIGLSACAPSEGATVATSSEAGPGALPIGATESTIVVGGIDRTYRTYVPAAVKEGAPLVMVLHGGFGSAAQAEQSYGWNALADQAGFVVVYPDALDRSWNAGDCCGKSAEADVDDVGFLGAVIEDVAARSPIDPDRVAMVGVSNGGFMTYRFACERGGLAAIGVVAGTLVTECEHPEPVSVMHIHGLADTNVPVDGGVGSGPAAVDGWPVAAVIDRWRDVDRCGTVEAATSGPVQIERSTCADGRVVELVLLDGAEHGWPGADGRRGDPAHGAYDATAELWTFLAERLG